MTIINYAKLGIRQRDDASRDKALNKILAAGNRAAKITNSILGMARNRSQSFEPTDLPGLIEDALVLLEREMSKYRIAVDRQFSEVPKALARGNQIQQVMLNLLINARQAMPKGGTITIGLKLLENENMIALSVRDTGSGIPQEKLPHIFDRFFSTKSGPDESGKGGTGLGLSACHDIIKAHNGRIRVESQLGRGTAFTLLLPVVQASLPLRESQPITSLGVPRPA